MTTVCFLAALVFAAQPAAVDSQEIANPFADFETHRLANGLKLWYKHLPSDPVVSISVALPFGSDRDPPGKEQLAHFTEHMVFSDQPGRTEEEIKREIEERGGVYNASVTADRTFYYVHIGSEHALYALEWLHRILAPHAMDPEVVERQREPVALEVRARPRQLFDWLAAYVINPPFLRTPGFWEQEFGLGTWRSRDYYPFRSLYGITSGDLLDFYDTYYVPSQMTLTVVGDIDRGAVLDAVTRTFATLPARAEPEPAPPARDPGRYRQTLFWGYRSDVRYSNRFKFYDLSADQEVVLVFIRELLSKRLNDRLRFGDRKATYGISVGIVKRGGAGYLHVTGGIKPEEFGFAKAVIEGELEALRGGTFSQEEFDADRAAVTRQLKVRSSASEDLEVWVRDLFYDSRVHADFPDLAGAFAGFTREEVQTFARDFFVPERQVLTIARPHPLTQGTLLLLAAVITWFTVHFTRRRLIRPVDMTRIRYVARFRMPRAYSVVAALALIAFLAVVVRFVAFIYEQLTYRHLVQLDSFLVQWLAYAAMLAFGVFLLMQVPAHIPRKILLFDDHLRIKYLSYRSVPIPADRLGEMSLLRFPAVWSSRRIWKCVPLTLGLLEPGIYLKRGDGWAYFFNVRDRDELVRLSREIAESDESGSSPEPPIGPPGPV
ncbi:MAG: insulinase family protein [Gemmatimonadota bacterium]|nr:MAG: insulinase family protein [Gemmatimonadota bacterium]